MADAKPLLVKEKKEPTDAEVTESGKPFLRRFVVDWGKSKPKNAATTGVLMKVTNKIVDKDKSAKGLEKKDAAIVANVWKLNADGDKTSMDDWFERTVWLSKTGILCYESKKENKSLFFFAGQNVGQLEIRKLKSGDCCRPNAFSIGIPSDGGLEFVPTVFACGDEKTCDNIIKECLAHKSDKVGKTPAIKLSALDASLQKAAEAHVKPKHGRASIGACTQTFCGKEDTVIIFDWDDTLCPSSWIWDHPKLVWNKPAPKNPEIREPLHEIEQASAMTLTTASRLGTVGFVTLAMTPWVETSIKNFLPALFNYTKPYPLTYARVDKYLPDNPHDCEMGQYAAQKMNAMKEMIRKHYGKDKAWKNIISVGDGEYERKAVQELGTGGHENPKGPDGKPIKMRTKTVKMLDEPDIAELHDQLQIINSWLPAMVAYDDDFDVALDDSDDSLFELHDLLAPVGQSQHPTTNRREGEAHGSAAAQRTHMN